MAVFSSIVVSVLAGVVSIFLPVFSSILWFVQSTDGLCVYRFVTLLKCGHAFFSVFISGFGLVPSGPSPACVPIE